MNVFGVKSRMCAHTSQKKEGFQTEKHIKIIPLDIEFWDDCVFIPISIGILFTMKINKLIYLFSGLKLNIQKTKIIQINWLKTQHSKN